MPEEWEIKISSKDCIYRKKNGEEEGCGLEDGDNYIVMCLYENCELKEVIK